MYDRRDDRTFYPQMVFTAINGVNFKGEKLKLLPVVETTWGLWKTMYPKTTVPRFATGLERYSERRRKNYEDRVTRYYESQAGYPYGTYRTNDNILFSLTTYELEQGGLHIKDMVLAICRDGQTKAYPFSRMPEQAAINDQVSSQPLLVVFHRPSRTALPYSRRVDERILTFYAVEPVDGLPVGLVDVETGSRWNMLGLAVDGPLQGRRLEQVPAYNSMWFAWKAFWPDTAVWDGEGVLEGVSSTWVDEAAEVALPQHLRLRQNYPNPFNPRTRIEYELPQSGLVRLAIYNIRGQRVRTLIQSHRRAGVHGLGWDGRDDAGMPVGSGTYFYRLTVPQAGFQETRPMVLVR